MVELLEWRQRQRTSNKIGVGKRVAASTSSEFGEGD